MTRSSTIVVATLAAWSVGAPAAADDVVIGVFQPTPSTTGDGFAIEPPTIGAAGTWCAAATLSYARDLLVVTSPTPGVVGERAIADRGMATVGGAYAFLDRFEVALALPLYLQRGEGDARSPFVGADAHGAATGDLAVHARVRLLHVYDVRLGASAAVTLPTATTGQYAGVDHPSLRLLGLASYAPDPRVAVGVMMGGVLRRHAELQGATSIAQGSAVAFGVGVNVRVHPRVWVSGEVFGDLVVVGRDELAGNTLASSPVEALVGTTYRVADVTLGFAVGRGVSAGIGAPDLRGVLSIRYGDQK